MLHPLLTAFSKHFDMLAHKIVFGRPKTALVFQFINLKMGVTTSYQILYAELRRNSAAT